MEAMGFSDQEEQVNSSAEAPELMESNSADDSAAPQAQAEAPGPEVESSQEDSASPSSDESPEIEPLLTGTDETESEAAAQADEVVQSEESAVSLEDAEPVQEIDQSSEDDNEMDSIPDESAPAESSAEQSEQESDDLDLSFLDQDQSESLEGDEDGRSWYVVHCYSGYENKVRHNLEQRIDTMGMKNMIFDIVVPTEEEIEVKEGKRRTVERRVFPGYILVNMIMTEESWYVVRNTPGVTGFVGMGNTPTPLRTEEVSQIIKRMEADAPRIKVTFKSGERVRIVDGPFNDFRGTVSEIDMERAKVRVMVNFFGRETPVELDFLQVEKT
jgi:transcriptional antiterminator NusG